MKIVYRPHLLRRLKERKIPKNYPRNILLQPDKEFIDALTTHHICVKKLRYAGKVRNMIIAYDIIGNNREIVTIYPISDSELRNKVRSRRWNVYEKN